MPGGLEKLHRLSPFLAWCLSSSLLISLSLSLCHFPSFAPLPSSACSRCLPTIFPTAVSFPLFFDCLYQSLNVIAAPLPSTLASRWHNPISISPTPIFIFSHATASPLLWWVCHSSPRWHSPYSFGSAWLGPHGSCWLASSQQEEVS